MEPTHQEAYDLLVIDTEFIGSLNSLDNPKKSQNNGLK